MASWARLSRHRGLVPLNGYFYGTDSGNTSNYYKATPSPAVAPSVQLTVPASVTHGTSFVLSYTVVNAASQTNAALFCH